MSLIRVTHTLCIIFTVVFCFPSISYSYNKAERKVLSYLSKNQISKAKFFIDAGAINPKKLSRGYNLFDAVLYQSGTMPDVLEGLIYAMKFKENIWDSKYGRRKVNIARYACSANKKRFFKYILQNKPEFLSKKDKQGGSLLFWCDTKNIDMFEIYLQAGGDLNVKIPTSHPFIARYVKRKFSSVGLPIPEEISIMDYVALKWSGEDVDDKFFTYPKIINWFSNNAAKCGAYILWPVLDKTYVGPRSRHGQKVNSILNHLVKCGGNYRYKAPDGTNLVKHLLKRGKDDTARWVHNKVQ